MGLTPPNKARRPPKLKYETLYINGIFLKFVGMSRPPHKRKDPFDDFLATVLIESRDMF